MDFLAGILVGGGLTMLAWPLFSGRHERVVGLHIARDARLFDMSKPDADRTDFTACGVP